MAMPVGPAGFSLRARELKPTALLSGAFAASLHRTMKPQPVKLMQVYQALERHYTLADGWPEGEWPISGRFRPPQFEVVVGAILTQNNSWKNAEQALKQMRQEGLVEAGQIVSCPVRSLESIIRSSGFYRQKARRLKEMARFILDCGEGFYREVERNQLLSVHGVGRETADSILLYACSQKHFVVDAYTRRIFVRYGWFPKEAGYPEIQEFFQSGLEPDGTLYKRFHALIVEHAKQTCRKLPLCEQCVLKENCTGRRDS